MTDLDPDFDDDDSPGWRLAIVVGVIGVVVAAGWIWLVWRWLG